MVMAYGGLQETPGRALRSRNPEPEPYSLTMLMVQVWPRKKLFFFWIPGGDLTLDLSKGKGVFLFVIVMKADAHSNPFLWNLTRS